MARTDMVGLENTIALINSSLALSILIPSFSVSLQWCDKHTQMWILHTHTHVSCWCIVMLYNWSIYLVSKMWWSLSSLRWKTIGYICDHGMSSHTHSAFSHSNIKHTPFSVFHTPWRAVWRLCWDDPKVGCYFITVFSSLSPSACPLDGLWCLTLWFLFIQGWLLYTLITF